ncbi:MAG: DNA-binding transcriptional LysR family regulator [Gammaproteobacteria bacterium]|jgi:DNA-binding transcriptional LysR family regulator
MDLNLMRSLLSVVDAGAITAAADRVGLTQPALSRRIRQLEEELGVTLLSRGRKGVALTTAGELVAAEARVLVARYDSLRAEVAAHQRLEGGTIRLGGGATAVSFVLPPAIADFQREYPGVRFHLKEAGSREVEQDVVSGRLELGLVTLPVHLRELQVQPLLVDNIVLIARNQHPLASQQHVDVKALAGMSLVGFEAGSAIRHLIDAALRDAGVEMNVVMELRSIPAIVRMVAMTGNLAFVSQLGVDNERDVRAIRLRGLDIRRELAVISRRGVVLSPAAQAFVQRL